MTESEASKHTPGPWFVKDHQRTGMSVFSAPNQRLCAWLGPNVLNIEANARLIAAAPELLEALEQIDQAMHKEGFNGDRDFRVCGMAEAAIRKAKGDL